MSACSSGDDAAGGAAAAPGSGADDAGTGGGSGSGDDAGSLDGDGGGSGDAHAAGADAGADASDAGPPPDLGPAGDFAVDAARVAAALRALYDTGTGLFPSTGWWNSANAITALADYMIATGTSAYAGVLATTFSKNGGESFLNDYYDDEGWWALAWVRAYDLTNDARYLAMAKTIFADMKSGWDTTCNGGVWWRKEKDYKNAIANELFLAVAVALHDRTPGDAGPGSFLDWAQREWAWFDASGMINASSLVNDGLTSACKNNDAQTWTYNQGVIVGGLVDLSKATNDPALLTRAEAIADAAIGKLVDDVGALREPCEPSCGGDAPQFKGIFMRHLDALERATHEPRYQRFLTTNADWIWNAARDANDDVGLAWSQRFDAVDGARESSALDALVGAVPFASAAPNLALHKVATSNGACKPQESAAAAFDGTTSTKWCSGTSTGTYFLSVDLGAPAAVGRVVVRHAGAGGEQQAWNTKDFTVSTSLDGTSWTKVATITGNARAVTIHRFAAAQARWVRVDITAPQSSTTTVAARIDELEVYAR